jgi:hypothetical protein
MKRFGEYTHEEVEALDKEFHKKVTPWVEDHAERSGGDISDIGYNPDIYPWQRLSEAYTPPGKIPFWVPNKLIIKGIERALARNLDSPEKARAMVTAFQEAPSAEGSDTSVSDAFVNHIESHETVGILGDHTNNGDLRDIALITAALIASTGESELIEHTAIVMGKNIGRQAVRGKPAVPQATLVGGIVWVMQNTGKRRDYGFSKEVTNYINQGALEAIDRLKKEGLALGIVASASAMTVDEITQTLHRPPISPGTRMTLKRQDALLPVGMHNGHVIPGPIYVARDSRDKTTQEKRGRKAAMVDEALHTLAQSNANLVSPEYKGITYEDADGNLVTVHPQK